MSPGDDAAEGASDYNGWRLQIDGREVRATAVDASLDGAWVEFIVLPP